MGYFWIGFSVLSSFFVIHLRRAMSESSLLFFIVLLMPMSVFVLQKQEKNIKHKVLLLCFDFFIFGMLVGAAGSSKLNGLSLLGAGMILAFIVSRTFQPKIKKVAAIAGFILITLISSLLTWLILNPYLLPDPVNRAQEMLSQRVVEMSIQKEELPTQTIEGLEKRISIVPLEFSKIMLFSNLKVLGC